MAFEAGSVVVRMLMQDGGFSSAVEKNKKLIMGISAAAAAAAAAMAAAAVHTANLRDELTKTARASGVTVESFTRLSHAANLSGMGTETLSRSLRRLARPTRETATELDKLGISLRDSNGRARDAESILGDVAERFEGMGEAERAAAAINLFGERGSQMVNMLAAGREGLEEMTAEAERLGLVFDEQAGRQAELFNDNITRLRASMDGVVQSFGQTIIEAVNATGVFTLLTDAVVYVRQAWEGLGKDGQELVIYISGIVIGLGLLMGAFVAIQAIAPFVGAAMTIALGPVGVIVMAVAAGIAGLVALFLMLRRHASDAAVPIKIMKEAFDRLIESFRPLGQMIADLFSVGDSANDSAKEISVLGTVSRIIFTAMAAAIDTAVSGMTQLVLVIKMAISNFKFWQALLTGDLVAALGMQQRLQSEWAQFERAGAAFTSRMQTLFGQPWVVQIDDSQLEEARAQVDELSSEVSSIGSSGSGKPGDSVGPKGSRGKGGGDSPLDGESLFKQLNKQIMAALPAMVGLIVKALQKALEFIADYMEKVNEVWKKELAVTEERARQFVEAVNFYAELATIQIKKQAEAEIQAVKDAEDEKLAILNAAFNKRMAMRDEELNAILANMDAEFEAYLANEAIRMEEKIRKTEQESRDDEEARLNRMVLEEEFRQFEERKRREHEEKKSDRIRQEQSTTEILRDEHANAITKIESDKDARIAQIEETREAREKQVRKGAALVQWIVESAQLEAKKRIAKAEVVISTARSTAEMLGNPLMWPFIPRVISAAQQSIALIDSQVVFPPAELFMAQGGVVGGPVDGPVDTVPAMISTGEAVIDRGRTRQLLEMADVITEGGGQGMTVNVYLNNPVGKMDEETMDMIADGLGRRISAAVRR